MCNTINGGEKIPEKTEAKELKFKEIVIIPKGMNPGLISLNGNEKLSLH